MRLDASSVIHQVGYDFFKRHYACPLTAVQWVLQCMHDKTLDEMVADYERAIVGATNFAAYANKPAIPMMSSAQMRQHLEFFINWKSNNVNG